MITCQETSPKPYDRYHKGHQKKGYKYLRIIIQNKSTTTTKISAEMMNAMKLSSNNKLL